MDDSEKNLEIMNLYIITDILNVSKSDWLIGKLH